MEAHTHTPDGDGADTLVEEREVLMIPPSGGTPTLRKAHFLKPILDKHHLHLPPPPASASLLSSNPSFHNLQSFLFQKSKSCPSQKWKLWVHKLKPRYQETWKKSGIYHAILASTYSVPRDKMLVLGVAEWWCCDTNTFVFPWGEVTITLEDIVHLGCFSVLGSSVLTPLDDECIDILNCLKSSAKEVKFASGGFVTPSMWMEYIMTSGKDIEHEAFLAYWLCRFVLVRSQILLLDFQVAIHLSRGHRIALAPVVLACIYRDMRVIHDAMVQSVELESRVAVKFSICHYDLVQMWVWERFPELRPDPNVIERGEPRSARWNAVTKLNISNVRAALDAAKYSFLWRPYAMIPSYSMLSNLYKDNEQWVVVESDAVESFARCLRACELVGLSYTEQYLPHRVAMQFGFDQDIPPLVMNLVLGSYDRPIRGVKLYIPPRLFESDASSRYVAWWRGRVAVNENMVTNNHHKNELPLISCGPNRNAESLVTPDSLSGCVEKRLKSCLTSAKLMSQSGKPESLDKRNDHDDDPVLHSHDNVEEDSLTIAQLLKRSRRRNINNFENARHVGNELLNTVTSELMSISLEAAKKLTCPSEPVEPSVPLVSSSNLCELSKFSTEKQSEPKEHAVVARNLKFTNEPLEMSVRSMLSSENGKKRRSSTEGQTKVAEYAVLSPNDNIINLEEEIREGTSSELQHLGLKARIWRLETILDMIKAAKFGASSTGNPEK